MSHLFSHIWEYSIETKRIDDRQSFKRVRHRQKKNHDERSNGAKKNLICIVAGCCWEVMVMRSVP